MDWFLYDNGLRHERVKALGFSKTSFVHAVAYKFKMSSFLKDLWYKSRLSKLEWLSFVFFKPDIWTSEFATSAFGASHATPFHTAMVLVNIMDKYVSACQVSAASTLLKLETIKLHQFLEFQFQKFMLQLMNRIFPLSLSNLLQKAKSTWLVLPFHVTINFGKYCIMLF